MQYPVQGPILEKAEMLKRTLLEQLRKWNMNRLD